MSEILGSTTRSSVDGRSENAGEMSPNLYSSLLSYTRAAALNKFANICGSPTEKKVVTIASPVVSPGRKRSITSKKSKAKSNRVSFRSPRSLTTLHMLPEPAVLRYSSVCQTPFGSPRVLCDATPSMLLFPATEENNYYGTVYTAVNPTVGVVPEKDPDVSFKIRNRFSHVSWNYLSPKVGSMDPGVSSPKLMAMSMSDPTRPLLGTWAMSDSAAPYFTGGQNSDMKERPVPVDTQPQAFSPTRKMPMRVNIRLRSKSNSSDSQGTPEVAPAETVTEQAAEGVKVDETTATTLMLRNVPNKYTRDMLLADITSRGLMQDVDFFYMPIDLRHRCNVGYCFVNMTNLDAVQRFRKAFDGSKLDQVKSGKTCSVGLGKVQGLDANIEAYRNSAVVNMSDKYHPLLFDNGVPRAFPPPTLSREEIRQLRPKKKGVSTRQLF